MVTGGYSGGVATNSIYTFDPATSTWSIVSPSLQEARADHVTGVVDSALVTLGGVGKTSVEFVYPYGVSDTGATMPVAMNYMGGESVNTGTAEVIYLMGGVKYYIYGCNDAEYISTCQSVDPVSSWAWTSCAPLPTAKADVASVVMSGKIYVMGGRNCSGDLSEVNAYDPASNSWSTLSSMLYATSKASAATVDGKIYNFYQKDGEIKVEEYDPLRE